MPLPLLAPLLLHSCDSKKTRPTNCPRVRKTCLPAGSDSADVMLDEWNHIVWDNPEFGPPLPDNSKELIHVAFFDTRPSPSLREMGQAAAIFKHSHVVVHALLAHKPSAEAVPPGIRVTMMKMTKRLACIYDNFAHNSHGPGPALDSLAMAQSHATISNFNSFSQAYLIKTLLPWILPPEVPAVRKRDDHVTLNVAVW